MQGRISRKAHAISAFLSSAMKINSVDVLFCDAVDNTPYNYYH